MDQFTHQLADLLLEIEAEMRRIGLWANTPPPPEALRSLVPFCHDTLHFEQWMQWVLLPKMKRVVEDEEESPNSSDITPLAEYRITQLPHPTLRLLEQLEYFDHLINSRALR